MHDSIGKALTATLELERQAIVLGKFATVDELASVKQDLFDQFLKTRPKAKEMEPIRLALLRNQSLFSSALAGVQSAKVRLNALREVREGLRVYDESGRVAQVTSKSPELSKHT